MKTSLLIKSVLALSLSGCSVSYPSRATDPAYFFGSSAAPESEEPSAFAANGLVYADGSQALSDVEGLTLGVKVVRFLRDPDTDETVIVLSNEVAVLPIGFTRFADGSASATLDGETLTFETVGAGSRVFGATELDNGQEIRTYMNFGLQHSGTVGLYSNADISPSFEGEGIATEGFYAIGYETHPGTIATLGGTATYLGSFFGFGQTVDLEGTVLDSEVENIGAIAIDVDFDRQSASGVLQGAFDLAEGAFDYNMVFFDAAITGNGFVGAPDMICDANVTCTANSSLGAVFYGGSASEISGVIGFDQTIDPNGSEPATRFVGAAGFSTSVEVAED